MFQPIQNNMKPQEPGSVWTGPIQNPTAPSETQ